MNLMRGQPNVEAALITQPDTAQQELRKPTIGGRKQQTKRSGVWKLLLNTLLRCQLLFTFNVPGCFTVLLKTFF
jgi:hypothetical protein